MEEKRNQSAQGNLDSDQENQRVAKAKKKQILSMIIFLVMLTLIAGFIVVRINKSAETKESKPTDITNSNVEDLDTGDSETRPDAETSDFSETDIPAEETVLENTESEATSTELTFARTGDYYKVTGYTGNGHSVIIPETYCGKPVKEIDSFAFLGCSELTSITIPDSVTTIYACAFCGCTGLTNITIPDSVTSIGHLAFSGCTNLTNIIIPDSVTHFGGNAFSGCTNLTSINVCEGNLVYHSAGNCIIETASKTLIIGCKSSEIPTDRSVTKIGTYAFSDCIGLTDITIPSCVTSIEKWAFSYCTDLTNIIIPESVTCIGKGAFSNCSSLIRIYVTNGNPVYHSVGNCLIETASKTLIAGCKNSTIPTDGSITSIGDSAFEGCSGLTNITISNSVTIIGDSAFYDCPDLTCITIPDSVIIIGSDAFSSCTGLTSITIPNSITSIGLAAFSSCTSLTEINYLGTPSQWDAIGKGTDWDDDTGDYTIHYAS